MNNVQSFEVILLGVSQQGTARREIENYCVSDPSQMLSHYLIGAIIESDSSCPSLLENLVRCLKCVQSIDCILNDGEQINQVHSNILIRRTS